MEERRFDAWSRTLGAATSRRQLLKGALGGALAAVGIRAVEPAVADAATGHCGHELACRQRAAARRRSCFRDTLDILASCLGDAGPYGGVICHLQWRRSNARCDARFERDMRSCRMNGCTADDLCCDGACVNVHSGDPNNCGACGHACDECAKCVNDTCVAIECDDPFICQDGDCVCPPDTHLCSGPINDTCCAADEDCYYGALGLTGCAPKCTKCEVYDESTKTCRPKDCGDFCQHCDEETGQCVAASDGTDCGSGLTCCGGHCQDENETCNGKGGDDCPICQESDGNGNCLPQASGINCGACGQCNGNGACVPDPNRACAECFTCSESGVCMQADDNTACDGGVCCGGTCTQGEECACASGQHQCSGISGDPICCDLAVDCCVDANQNAMCGPYAGVCCQDDQYQCGTICCAAGETCGVNVARPHGYCCPNGTTLVADGSCCDRAFVCDTAGGTVCCSSGQECVYDNSSGYWACVA